MEEEDWLDRNCVWGVVCWQVVIVRYQRFIVESRHWRHQELECQSRGRE